MAERRMFSKKITNSDAFLDMPMSSQALYFHLNMNADDDGFLNNHKSLSRFVGANDDDLKLLIAKGFVIPFDSGIIVIKHWKVHNYIQKDRYRKTDYQEEFSRLELINNEYQYKADETPCIQNGYNMDTECIQNGYIGKDRLGKDRLGKDRLEINNTMSEIFDSSCVEILNFWNELNIVKHKMTKKLEDVISKKLNEIKKVSENPVLEMKNTIARYNTCLKDDNYQLCKYVWSIDKFLKQKNAYDEFTEDGIKWLNYLNSSAGKSNIDKQIMDSLDLNIEGVF